MQIMGMGMDAGVGVGMGAGNVGVGVSGAPGVFGEEVYRTESPAPFAHVVQSESPAPYTIELPGTYAGGRSGSGDSFHAQQQQQQQQVQVQHGRTQGHAATAPAVMFEKYPGMMGQIGGYQHHSQPQQHHTQQHQQHHQHQQHQRHQQHQQAQMHPDMVYYTPAQHVTL
ncbi:hypothetical protein BD779DRAFT_777437 [Infundibulicybe gibba]|nr:hypothetical protein BD779DRAFT_777437 [Infundibulicybe gibba]